MRASQSPKIQTVGWGSVVLEDGTRYKDAKLYPGGAREWDWRETGTRHAPGIQFADVQELIEHGATVIVLSRGQLGRLQVASETLRILNDLGLEVHVLQTKEAVEMYQRLRLEASPGALIHSTC